MNEAEKECLPGIEKLLVVPRLELMRSYGGGGGGG